MRFLKGSHRPLEVFPLPRLPYANGIANLSRKALRAKLFAGSLNVRRPPTHEEEPPRPRAGRPPTLAPDEIASLRVFRGRGRGVELHPCGRPAQREPTAFQQADP